MSIKENLLKLNYPIAYSANLNRAGKLVLSESSILFANLQNFDFRVEYSTPLAPVQTPDGTSLSTLFGERATTKFIKSTRAGVVTSYFQADTAASDDRGGTKITYDPLNPGEPVGPIGPIGPTPVKEPALYLLTDRINPMIELDGAGEAATLVVNKNRVSQVSIRGNEFLLELESLPQLSRTPLQAITIRFENGTRVDAATPAATLAETINALTNVSLTNIS